MSQTSQEAYQENLVKVEQQILILVENLKIHKAKQLKDPKNWGFSGDMNYVLNELTDINNFLN